MTCRIQAKITYNWPIVVEKTQPGGVTHVLFKSDGEPKAYIGEHTYELDDWFSGDQCISVKEQ